MKSILRKLKALSDATRIKLLFMLTSRSLCVCEMTSVLGLAQPTVSRHLKQLEDAGFVRSRREGPWTLYSIDPDDDRGRQMLELVISGLQSDSECQNLLGKLGKIDRRTISGCGDLKRATVA
jgi:ArsR family transcriptional regulator